MKILITGGAGYIGSHMVEYATNNGHEVTILDNLSTGHKWAVNNNDFYNIDLLDKTKLGDFFKNKYYDGVIHFAGRSLVGESNTNPSLYYLNNVVGTLNLLDVMKENNIKNLVFSSTAAVYGKPSENKILETHDKKPINNYGKSKLMVEQILEDYVASYGFNVVALRYFNAAGASLSGLIGEAHFPETHLIPNILKSCLKKNATLKVFGNNYDTPDGTCVRDYVHVLDLAKAHMLSLTYLFSNRGFRAFNLGNGNGFSVLDIINAATKVTKLKVNFQIAKPRDGDPSVLVADSNLAKTSLGWEPKYTSIEDIISSAWNWHKEYEKRLLNGEE